MSRSLSHRSFAVFRILAVLVLLLGTAGQVSTAAPLQAQPTGPIDLATYPATRWIVQLSAAPLAWAASGGTSASGAPTVQAGAASGSRLDVSAPASQAYIQRLQADQQAFLSQLSQVAPGAQVQQSYQVVLNGLAVKMTPDQAAAARQMPGVLAVTPDIPFQLDMFSTPEQIGAPALWAQLGGQANAGAGVKVAIIDSGIYVTRDAQGASAGNACFNDTGYTAPAGYPRGDTRFTNNKVLVARAYFRPDDPPLPGDETAIPGPQGSNHGTHVAGTVACNPTPVTFEGANVTISGVAPHAYLLNYRVFYPSVSNVDFQTGNAYVAELVRAIEDAVSDGADVVSNSWGSTYQNTRAWPDPMIRASEAAVDAGVVMVYANGNAGADTGTVISPAISPKVIGVGAVTKNATIAPGKVSVTAPAPVPLNLQNLATGPAQFGPQVTANVGPAPYVPAEVVSTATTGKSLACSLPGDVSPFPAGSLTGKIALIARGTCNFSEKVFNAQRGGAIAAFIYNSVAGGDNLQAMGAGVHATDVTIPSWLLRRTDGLNMVTYYSAHPGQAEAQFVYGPGPVANAGDVMAGFSSRGPTMDKLIKPDVVAPGVDILSSGYATAAFPGNLTGFGTASGTSMATPHVARAAALLKALHPNWGPWQIKSALMNTATEKVYLDTNKTQPAGVLDRGAGRIDLTRAGNPGLTFDPPSLSGRELVPGQGRTILVAAHDESGTASTWSVSVVLSGTAPANIAVAPSRNSLSVGARGIATFSVDISARSAAVSGDYQGELQLSRGGAILHLPIWTRVISGTVSKQVLVLDDDGSSVDPKFKNYSQVYTSTLEAAGLSYDYVDTGIEVLPSLYDYYKYRAVLIFTGDNDSNGTSGIGPSDQNNIAQWMDSGGRLITSGQNFAEVSDTNGDYSAPTLGRSRLYHGYLGLTYLTGSVFAGAAPRPTADGVGPMAGIKLDLSPGADGAGNQTSIEGTVPMTDTDTYMATPTTRPAFLPIGGSAAPGTGIGFARNSDITLELPDRQYLYRSLSLGFGLESINNTTGFSTTLDVMNRAYLWLFDSVQVEATCGTVTNRTGRFTASATSATGSPFVQYRWSFGERGHVVTTTTASIDYTFLRNSNGTLSVEAMDELGHTGVATCTFTPPPDQPELFLPLIAVRQ